MITTRGFRDVIELGRRTRPQPYGMTGTFVPVIPRNLRLEVSERVEASGNVRTPLDEDEMRAAVAALIAAGCESLVIHFLHSYANPAHELARRRNRRRTLAERLHHHRPFAAVGGARVRARRDCRGQRLGAADPGALCRAAAQGTGGQGLCARLPDHERQWRHDLGAFRDPGIGKDGDVRPGLRRHRRRLYGTARRLPQPRHLRHGRHLDRRRADPQFRAGGLQRDRDRIRHADPCADGGGAHGRRRRRLDRARRRLRADPDRPGKRGRQSRARSAMAAAARSRPSPTPIWCSAGSIRSGLLSRRRAGERRRTCGKSSNAGSARRPASTASRRRARCCASAT